MRVLITGGDGLLGRAIAKVLVERNISHVSITRRDLELTDPDKVKEFFNENRFTNVINAAAMTNVDQCETDREKCYLDNVVVVKNIVNSIDENIHLVQISTDFVFDGTKGFLTEDEVTNPINYYGDCKLDAEVVVRKFSNAAILRTQLVYGTAKKNIISWVKESLEQGKEIPLLTDQWRCPTFVDDLAEACALAIERNAKGIYHVSGKDCLSPFWLAIEVAKFFNLNEKLIKKIDSATLNQTAKRPLKTTFNIEKARTQLGYNPRSFKECLAIYNSQMWGGKIL